MLEYLILSDILKKTSGQELETGIYNREYNLDKMIERYCELKGEFLEPYVIESDSKE